jgi:hypothetical protein
VSAGPSRRSLERFIWINFEDKLREAIQHLKLFSEIKYLPYALIDSPEFAENLPSIPAVYFVCRPPPKKPLYIGRTRNLKVRWTRDLGRNPASLEVEHHMLKRALKARNAVLFWLKTPPEHLTVVEMLLIQMHKPTWNTKRR